MNIVENKNPLWTNEHIQHLRKYKENYGLYITEQEFSEELSNIEQGKPSKRCVDAQRCFEIYKDEEYIGDITITKIEDKHNELDIVIFDKCANKGYAKEAINKFEKIYFDEIGTVLDVIIREDNPNKDKVKSILEANDFKLVGYNDYEDLIFSKSKEK
ncbi:GNAT family N-acetyltransferase [Asaccharospora irregularis]|uniref:Protein N-acetyltransferase, RimJ/RimL family n=1 Tax=Asaccharospora irregularis DSM 2635 TaxID=1121321 RepID=A0A1M5RFJ7_9FIRM|nr:GNAT family N-acetyltransferase [Asaccharospora irregularis]SHH25095.1 Protein N-acetyltransferase, RimJ/RimL family [Asaccharospora irregularis DSM 2635]